MERDNFEKVDGKYDLVKIDYEVSSQVMEKRRKKSAPVQSKLDPVLQVGPRPADLSLFDV